MKIYLILCIYIFKRKVNGVVPWKKNAKKNVKNRENHNKKIIEMEEKSVLERQEKTTNNNVKDMDASFISKSNHRNSAFRFSLYLERKDSFKLNKLPIISYINPNEDLKKNGIPNFSKMPKRDDKMLCKPSNYPSICYYEPKYDYIKKSPVKSIKFANENQNNKRKNIKKILCSYDVPRDYLIVDVENAQRVDESEIDVLLGE